MKHIVIMAREESRAELDFFLISQSQGYISTAGGPLNFPFWVALQPAEVRVISLCIFCSRAKDPWKIVKEGSATKRIPCSSLV